MAPRIVVQAGFKAITYDINFSKLAVQEGTEMSKDNVLDVTETKLKISGSVLPSRRQAAGTKPYKTSLKVFIRYLIVLLQTTNPIYL